MVIFYSHLSSFRFEEQNILPSFYSGRITKSYWGWVSGFGPGELSEIDRTLKAPQYEEILENVFLPSVNALFGEHAKLIIIEDNSSAHRADLVKDWWAAHPRFMQLDLPSKSPDINVIEIGQKW